MHFKNLALEGSRTLLLNVAKTDVKLHIHLRVYVCVRARVCACVCVFVYLLVGDDWHW